MQKKKTLCRPGLLWCERLCDIYLGLLFTLFLLLAAPFERITAYKYLLLKLLGGGFILLSLLLIAEFLLIRRLSIRDLKCAARGKTAVLLFAAAYVLFTALSALFTPYSYDVFTGMSRYDGLLTHLIYVGSFLLLALFGRLKRWHLYALGVSVMIFFVICLLQISGENPFELYPAGRKSKTYMRYARSFLGTLGNAGLVAGFLSLVIGLFWGILLTGKRKERFLTLLPLGAGCILLLQINIAAGFVGVAAMLFVSLPLALHAKKSPSFKYALAAEAMLALGGIAVLWLYDFGGSGTLYEFHELLHFRLQDSFGSGRIRLWRLVLAEMPKHLLFGTGPDSMKAWEMELLSGTTASGEVLSIGIDAAHSEYLNIAAQQGLAAFAAYAALLLSIIKHFLSERKSALGLAIFFALTAYAVQALFGNAMCMVTPLFWALLGTLINQSTSDHTEES